MFLCDSLPVALFTLRHAAGLSDVPGQHQLAGDCAKTELQGSRPSRGKR